MIQFDPPSEGPRTIRWSVWASDDNRTVMHSPFEERKPLSEESPSFTRWYDFSPHREILIHVLIHCAVKNTVNQDRLRETHMDHNLWEHVL